MATNHAAPAAPAARTTSPRHSAIPAAATKLPGRTPLPRTAEAATASALQLINQYRAQAGCTPLKSNPALTATASAHSEEEALTGSFGNSGAPNENNARGPADPQALLNTWLASPQSRANLLNCGFHSTGLGAYFNGTGFWWTEEFQV
ncbi:CAP domain-containing protein [Streptomyces vinaceus]|uniref:CAP domain-containing protein n=1 Tax=Streptomyces vinaceus TaxID=1960 RepID=UPI00381868FC